jgi:hypothetical protein
VASTRGCGFVSWLESLGGGGSFIGQELLREKGLRAEGLADCAAAKEIYLNGKESWKRQEVVRG